MSATTSSTSTSCASSPPRSIGAEPPELIELRRISLGSIIKVVLPAVALVALISGMAGLDWEDLWSRVRDANWWLVGLGFIAAQVPRVAQAMSTMGASPIPLPLGPVYALQLSTSYINLAVPTTAGRVALNIRFFQRHGVPPGTAIAAGALDSFSGFIVQMVLLATLLLFTPASLNLQFDDTLSTAGRLVVIALVIFGVGDHRRAGGRQVAPLRPALGQAAARPRGGRRCAGCARRAGCCCCSAATRSTEILFSCALGVFVAAMGYRRQPRRSCC